MSRLEELIQTLCPDGVEFGKLGGLGDFYGGLTGKTKSDFQNGNSKFISYMNVYKNPAIDIGSADFVKVSAGERQNSVQYGDILFTGSSETPEECGISSVMVNPTDEMYYLNSFCIGFRLNNPGILNPQFSKHLFRSAELRKQINRTANGVTRFNVSKQKLSKVIIAIPPLPIQEEIVRILDSFTALEAELEKELEARTKQYEYYRDALLNFDPESLQSHSLRPTRLNHLIQTLCPDGVEYEDLKNLATISRGVRVVRSQLTEKGEFPVYQNSLTPMGFFEESNCTANSAFIISAGAAGDIGFCTVDFWAADDCFFFTDHERLHNKFLFYSILCQQKFLYSQVRRASVPRLARTVVEQLRIPVPPLPVQEEIVSILDRFEALVGDLKSGLPAEIALRRKQYEYYRDQLLTFQPLP